MYKAEFSLISLSIAGVWRPISYTLFFKVTLYKIFTIFAIFLLYSFDISLCMYFVLHSLHDIDEFAEALCWFLAFFTTCVKMTNFLLRRDDILDLIKMLSKDCFQPRDNIEKSMQSNCDFMARRNTKYFLIICLASVTTITLGQLLKEDIDLPLKASFPYEYNRTATFWITYISQCLSIYCAGFVTVGTETFVIVMMIQICSQLDIIYHRLQNLPHLYINSEMSTKLKETEETKIIKECVLHHNYVYKFSNKLNDIFSVVFAVQFVASILNICTLEYSLSSKHEINDKVIIQGIVLSNSLFQIFLYSWFGNQVILKSLKVADVVSMIDWTMITRKTEHGLLLISIRARYPIIIRGGSLIPMSLDTFITILRTSYAAYNLLQNSGG